MGDSDQNKIIGICCVNMCLVGIAQIVLAVVVYMQMSDGTNRYEQLLNNWEQNVITDIYMPQNDQKCLASETSIFTYYWPGTSSGCKCFYGTIKSQSCCGIITGGKHCCYGTTLNEQVAQTFDHWVTPTKEPLRLCAKRLQDYNFRKNAPIDLNCKDSEKKCGGQDQENAQNLYCVPKDQNCPIQEIYMKQNSQNSLQEYPITNGTHSVTLFINRNSNKMLPLSEFRVSSSLEACWDETESYIPYRVSILDRRSDSCSRTSTFYSDTTFEVDEQSYFKANKVNTTMNEYFPSNYPLHLLQNQYVNMKMSCRDQIEPLYNNNSQINSIHNFCIALLTLIILNQIAVVAFNLSRKCFMEASNKICMRFTYFIKSILILVCLIVAIILINKYITQINLLENYTDLNCFDGDSDSMISSIQKKFNRGCIIGLIVMLIYQIVTDTDIILYYIHKNNSGLMDNEYHPF